MYLAKVAPHWGAWIEILASQAMDTAQAVAPHWGAWIEIAGLAYV